MSLDADGMLAPDRAAVPVSLDAGLLVCAKAVFRWPATLALIVNVRSALSPCHCDRDWRWP
jgi:hypothetical protein